MAEAQDKYTKIRLLGEGSNGRCYLVNDSEGHLFVLKQINVNLLNENDKENAIKESQLHSTFNHKYIVRFIEVYNDKKGKLCIILEYADGGDLKTRIDAQQNVSFYEDQVLTWFTMTALAIKHLHDSRVIHRDIKIQNVFLTRDNVVKLGDFGISKTLDSTQELAKTVIGTPFYLSPEIVQNQPYNFKSDIWSLGVLLYELCSLRPPFIAQSLHQLILSIVEAKYPPLPNHFSAEMQHLVALWLNKNPNARLDIDGVLAVPIVAGKVLQLEGAGSAPQARPQLPPPAQSPPVYQQPMQQGPMYQAPYQQAPYQQAPMFQAPMQQAPNPGYWVPPPQHAPVAQVAYPNPNDINNLQVRDDPQWHPQVPRQDPMFQSGGPLIHLPQHQPPARASQQFDMSQELVAFRTTLEKDMSPKIFQDAYEIISQCPPEQLENASIEDLIPFFCGIFPESEKTETHIGSMLTFVRLEKEFGVPRT